MNTDEIMLAALKAVLDSRWHLRLGQAVYNVARDRYPAIVVDLAGTNVDPFYRDDRIRVFLKRVAYLCDRID